MNPFFSAIIYSVLNKRIKCVYCGSFDHHKRIGRGRYLCRNCNKEFNE